MAKITVNNPKNVINSKIGKNYFKLVGTGGPKGDKGDKGDTGTAATISAGTASSLPAGSSPTVTNSGTSSAAVFNFGIPKGDKGDKGDTGETGPTGPTGLDGQAATVTVGTVTTGAPGTSATVVNSGTTSAAVLDFTIPRGDKGESGSGTGDMVKADYDANNAVADAGGIASYVEANAAHIEGVNSLPATGADETLYLTSDEQKSTGSATGSAIQIQTDGQASILDFEMQGNATQNGTPTPDAPVAVNTTTGENVVKITGKNLFDKSATSGTFRATQTINGESITSTCSTAGQSSYVAIIIPNSDNLLGKTCTISYDAQASTGSAYLRVFQSVSSSPPSVGSSVKSITGNGHNESTFAFPASYQTGKDCFVVLLYPNSNQSIAVDDYATYTNIQLELGTATAYEPYQGQDYEVNLGKNLFNSFNEDSSWVTVETDGTMKLNGTSSANGYTGLARKLKEMAPNLQVGETYYLYITSDWSGNKSLYTSAGGHWTNGQSKTITQAMLDDTVVLYGGYQTTTTIRIMITKTLETSYAPYFTPIELAKIGTYQDRIYKNDGKWYIEKQTGNAVLNGSETWFLGQTLTNTVHFNIGDFTTILTGAVVPDETQVGLCLSDHFEEKANLYGIDQVGIDLHSNKNLIVGVPSSIATTVAGFTTWLSTHPTTVYYALATPTTTEITEQALIDQLEAIVSANLPQGVVNISLTGTGAQGCMVVEYEIGPEINYGYVYLNGKYVSLGSGGGSTEGLAEVALTGDYDDLINQPTIPTKTSDLTNDSGYLTSAGAVTSFNGSTGAVTYAAPVTSVNGSTGAVTVNVPTKTSDLNNDSGFLTSSTGVTSVNGNTGAVTVTVPTATSDLNNDSGFISTSDTGTVSTTMLANGAVTSAKLGLTSSTLPSIAWDSSTVAGTSGLEGLVYADLVIINNAYVARSQTAWNANWQNIGTLPTGYRPKTQTIFPAIFTDINSGNVTGYGRVRFNTSGVIDAKANATVSNAYCCFSGVFVTV